MDLCREENRRETVNTDYLHHLLSCILLRVAQLLPHREEPDTAPDDPIQDALLYLRMHFRENPPLNQLAEIAHYSTCHFCATFHKKTGMTYTQYLNLLKTEYAEKLLLSTDLSITDVSCESGFSSHATFLRVFREKNGQSPSLYRKTHSLCHPKSTGE